MNALELSHLHLASYAGASTAKARTSGIEVRAVCGRTMGGTGELGARSCWARGVAVAQDGRRDGEAVWALSQADLLPISTLP